MPPPPRPPPHLSAKKRAVRVAITRLCYVGVEGVWVPARIVERRCGWGRKEGGVAWAAGRVGKGRRSERLIKDAQR